VEVFLCSGHEGVLSVRTTKAPAREWARAWNRTREAGPGTTKARRLVADGPVLQRRGVVQPLLMGVVILNR
jgi:hypothetical protein